MQQIVNRIYWAPNFDSAYGFGSQIQREADGTVTFKNPFMPSGLTIKHWTVAQNYQATKLVPQLPHLKIGHQYRLVFHGQQEPRNTIIIRLTFFDGQWQKIKHYDFTNQNVYFTVPKGTINYTLELINAGNHKLVMHCIEICENNIPAEANQELWFQKRINAKSERPLRLLLVKGGTRSKKNYPEIEKYVGHYPYQVMVMSTQYHGNIIDDILHWLNKQRQYRATLISCHPDLDSFALDVQTKLPSLKTLVTQHSKRVLNAFDSHFYSFHQNSEWVNANITDPDWVEIFQGIRQELGGV